MAAPEITNRPGPDCDLTIRMKFATEERFREEYRDWISKGRFFIETTRSKPLGTRVQLVFILQSMNDLEIWTWGTINQIHTPEEAAKQQGRPGLELRLMDITKGRRQQIEALFGADDVVEAIRRRHEKRRQKQNKTSYTQVARSERQELYDRAQDLLTLSENGDHYKLLGVPRNSTEEAVGDAYRKLSKDFHPDRHFNKVPKETIELLQKLFEKITEAYQTLNRPERRAAYDTSIGNYTNPEAMKEAMPHRRLRRQFAEAYKQVVSPRADKVKALIDDSTMAMKSGDYKAARSKLQIAKAMDPLNPLIKGRLKKLDKLLSEGQDKPAKDS